MSHLVDGHMNNSAWAERDRAEAAREENRLANALATLSCVLPDHVKQQEVHLHSSCYDMIAALPGSTHRVDTDTFRVPFNVVTAVVGRVLVWARRAR